LKTSKGFKKIKGFEKNEFGKITGFENINRLEKIKSLFN
jgi:hypothetical protein